MFTAGEIQDIQKMKEVLINYFRPRLEQFPDNMKTFLVQYGILTGGASASVFHHDIPNDYDVYLENESAVDTFTKMIESPDIMKFIKDVNEKYIAQVTVKGKLITARAVTFNNDIQVITCKTADSRKAFDFVHCMPYLSIKDYKYYISKEQYDSIKNKQLKINIGAERTPDGHRFAKFVEKGWKE